MRRPSTEHGSAFAPTVLERWLRRENLLPGAVLVVLTAACWIYAIHQASAMGSMEPGMNADMTGDTIANTTADMGGDMSGDMDGGMADAMGGMKMSGIGGFALFLSGWAAMMVAMMLPATLPLILLYRTVARRRLNLVWAAIGMVVLLTGYIAVWTVVGLPVYAYNLLAEGAGMALLPGVLLIAGGVYQFTALKGDCHARCSNPLFFLMHRWRPGTAGALRLGVLHGLDCLGCCVGLMVGLVALGMMNLAWMLTAALIIFVEKTLPGSHRISYPLGILMVAGGVALLGMSLFNEMGAT